MRSTDPRASLDHAFTFAVYVLGSRFAALAALQFAADRAPPTPDPMAPETLLRLVRDAIARLGARSRPVTETLPAVWNGELTRELPPELVEDEARSAAL